MRRTTAQNFLKVSGILVLLGGGSCFFVLNPPFRGGAANGWLLVGGLGGLGALALAVILGIIGLIGLVISRRDSR